MKHHRIFRITETSNVGELRRAVVKIAKNSVFSEEEIGKIGIIANEMATNLLKHAEKGGQVLVRSLCLNECNGFEIISLDKGPGIKNTHLALRDGYSTAGSSGTGLGAIRRLSHEFDIYSQEEKGTAILSKVWAQGKKPEMCKQRIEYGVLSTAKPGLEVCGDDWCVEYFQGRIMVLLVDGLGHGEGASEAAQQAVGIFKNHLHLPLEDILHRIHSGLRSTRGAVVGVASIHAEKAVMEYAGIGNIAARIITSSKSQSCISFNGTMGIQLGKVQRFTYEWPKDAIFIINSDGFATNISLNSYNGLLNHSMSALAAVLFRDFACGNDDTSMIAIKSVGSMKV